jgi:Alginate export
MPVARSRVWWKPAAASRTLRADGGGTLIPVYARTGALRVRIVALGLAALGASAAAPLCAQDAEEEAEAEGMFDGGRFFANARYRAETVEENGPLRDALASTLRTSAGFETNPELAFSALIEAEDVHAIGSKRFNSTTNGRRDYNVVADPDGTELNQAYLTYNRSGFRARAGRQAIVLDNSRFVGDVGFRQNQQTYDSVTLQATTPGGSRFIYDYLWRVHRFLGEDHPLGELDLRTHLLNYSLGRLNGDRLTAYAYLLELDEQAFLSSSTKTFGASYDGGIDIGTRRFIYRAEYAHQSDYADNPGNVDAWYGNVELGLRFARLWTVTAGLELLSGDGTSAFQTPLATLHKFTGTADVIGDTPPDGIEDRYVRVYAPIGGVRLSVTWHDFQSERGSLDYGSELDAELEWRVTTHWLVGAKFADYRAQSIGPDTRKAWLWVQAEF